LFVGIFKGIMRCLAILVRFLRLLLLRFSLTDIGSRNRGRLLIFPEIRRCAVEHCRL
jgi:hypothetical protein